MHKRPVRQGEGGPQKRRTKGTPLSNVTGRRPRSAVAAYGGVRRRNWEGIGLQEPGIGPVYDQMKNIMYPLEIGETGGEILYQQGRWVVAGDDGVCAWQARVACDLL